MKFNEEDNSIEMFQNDYGIPINFEAEDFHVNDEIVFVVENDIIEPKTFEVTNEPFSFNLCFTEEEAEKLTRGNYYYSYKQYRDGRLLDTVLNGEIKVRRTVLWQN